MTNPTFLVAKYVPDLNRMEPRNIGVLLWANGKIAGKFLPAAAASFVESKDAYDGWVTHWFNLAGSSSIRSTRGDAVPVAEVASMQALLSHQEGEYLLVNAGELLENISPKELPDAVDYLFNDLVSTKVDRVDDKNFERYCDQIIGLAQLDSREDFHRKYGLKCEVFGVERHFQASYGLGNGHPNAVFQRVVIGSSRSVDSTALMMSAIDASKVVARKHTAALVHVPSHSTGRELESLALLKRVTRVIDVSDKTTAANELIEVATVGSSLSS